MSRFCTGRKNKTKIRMMNSGSDKQYHNQGSEGQYLSRKPFFNAAEK
jgi:hypothetical protein